jgi:hypothetical protein
MGVGDDDSSLESQRGSSGCEPERCTVDRVHQQRVVIAERSKTLFSMNDFKVDVDIPLRSFPH